MDNESALYALSNMDKLSSNRSKDVAPMRMDDAKSQQAKTLKFGNVDHQRLLSRLYSTPLQTISTGAQAYALDMSVGINKPRIRKLEVPPAPVEPVVSVSLLNGLHRPCTHRTCSSSRNSSFKHRLFFHQQWNAPESIQARNKEILIAEGKLVQESLVDLEHSQPIAKRRKPLELEPISRDASATTSRPGSTAKTASVSMQDNESKPRRSSSAKSKSGKVRILMTSIKGDYPSFPIIQTQTHKYLCIF
jgi:hypothetical protein